MKWGESFLVFWAVVLIWDIIWRGLALWRAAREKSKGWFVAILLLNTVGLLPIVYLLYTRGKKNK
jgi:hypothetical protein